MENGRIEAVVLEKMRSLLTTPGLTADGDVVVAGFDSLAAVELATELEVALGRDVSEVLLAHHRTVREIAEAVVEANGPSL